MTRKNGYTLIELMVSVTVFSIVMLAATAAYLSFVNYNRRATQVASLMNSLSFAIDSMARDMRTGTAYGCVGSCSSNGDSRFTFTNADGCRVTYFYQPGELLRITAQTLDECVPRSDVPLISPAVTPGVILDDVRFYVRGTTPGDDMHAIVTVVLRGSTLIVDTGETIPFVIETSATPRVPDLTS